MSDNFYVKLSSYDVNYDNPIIDVTLYVDMRGLAKIMELDAESKKQAQLSESYADLAKLQREIDEFNKE